MIQIDNVSVQCQNKLILNSISCNLPSGRITTFIGKSGAGKTSILKSIVGLNHIAQGTITINNSSITTLSSQQRAQKLGYVFQDYNLFAHLSVLQNCIDPLIIQGVDIKKATQIAQDKLQQLDMNQYLNSYPSQLSGGQKQRVAIARALCLQSQALLLDEPTASLDPINTEILVTILKKLAMQGLIIGVSSQDMNFVTKIFDRVYFIESGQVTEFCDNQNQLNQFQAIKSFIISPLQN